MRFFSHEWASLDDAEAKKIADAHWRVVQKIDKGIAVNLTSFVEKCDLRGALLDKITIHKTKRCVDLQLVSGDNQSGYYSLLINYKDALISKASNELEAIFESRSSRIRFDEFDIYDSDKPCHRFLLWPRNFGEIEIQFSDLGYQRTSIDDRCYRSFGEFVEVAE